MNTYFFKVVKLLQIIVKNRKKLKLFDSIKMEKFILDLSKDQDLSCNVLSALERFLFEIHSDKIKFNGYEKYYSYFFNMHEISFYDEFVESIKNEKISRTKKTKKTTNSL